MPISVKCDSCGSTLRAPDAAAGKKVKCPKCAAVMAVPAADAGTAPVSAAPPTRPAAPPSRKPAPEPPPGRPDDEDDDRPARRGRRDPDAEDDDRPSRRDRRDRDEDAEPQKSTGAQLGLGITSLVLAILGIPFSFIPWCGSFIALPLGGLALLLGGIGLIIALASEKRGMGFPIAGVVCSLIPIGIAVAWWVGGAVMIGQAANQAAIAMEEARKLEEARKEAERKQRETDLERLKADPKFAEQSAQSRDNLRKLAQAMLAYEADKGHLPASAWSSQPGRPEWSWRVAIMPYLGGTEKATYDKLKLDAGPDDPANRNLLFNKMPAVFRSPREPNEKNMTFYQVFAGHADGLFANNKTPRLADLRRGAADTLLIVEGNDRKEWYRPGDIDYTGFFGFPPVGGIFNNHFHAATADGNAYFVSRVTYSDDDLKTLVTAEGVGRPSAPWPPLKE